MLAVGGGLTYLLFFASPRQPNQMSFDPVKVARLERDVWEANARKESLGLFIAVVAELRERHGYTWWNALDAGFHRSKVIAAFRQTRTHMEQLVPDLERVYSIERNWYGATFDSKAAATAELSAWIARRRPELANEGYVGSLLAERDGIRFGLPPSSLSGPATLEARAALIGDEEKPDWAAISVTLRESFGSLHKVVNQFAARASASAQ